MKKCSKCGRIKRRSSFYDDKRASDGKYSTCKDCAREISNKSYAKTK